jgi:hypothetical protein
MRDLGVYEVRKGALIRLADLAGNDQYSGSNVATALDFLNDCRSYPVAIAKNWLNPESVMVGLRIRMSYDCKFPKTGRGDIASSLVMSTREVDRHIKELRSYRLIGPDIPYVPTEIFDSYMGSLFRTAETGCKILRTPAV